MWGPTNSLVEENSSSNYQKGLTPRVFELLFARINEVSLALFSLNIKNFRSFTHKHSLITLGRLAIIFII